MPFTWYYTMDGKTKLGPVSLRELQDLLAAGTLNPTHMVMQDGTPTWFPAESIPDLFSTPQQNSPRSPVVQGDSSLWMRFLPSRRWGLLSLWCLPTLVLASICIVQNRRLDQLAVELEQAKATVKVAASNVDFKQPAEATQQAAKNKDASVVKAPVPPSPPPGNRPRNTVSGYVADLRSHEGKIYVYLVKKLPRAGYTSVGGASRGIQESALSSEPPTECRFESMTEALKTIQLGGYVTVTGVNVGTNGDIVLERAEIVAR